MSIAAMKQALEALGSCESMLPEYHQWLSDAQYELRAAIEAAEKVERVACTCADFVTNEIGYMKAFTNLPYNTDLYTTPQPAIPDGWVLVPAEPTPEMQRAMQQAEWPDEAYKAMLAAAPKEMK